MSNDKEYTSREYSKATKGRQAVMAQRSGRNGSRCKAVVHHRLDGKTTVRFEGSVMLHVDYLLANGWLLSPRSGRQKAVTVY